MAHPYERLLRCAQGDSHACDPPAAERIRIHRFQLEVLVDGRLEILVDHESGVELLVVAGLDQQIPEWKVEA